jgi:hypothetical protein
MPSTDLPATVVTFVADHLASVHELNVLATLSEASDRWLTVQTTAERTGMRGSLARKALDRLVSRNLLDIRVSDDVRYQYRPGTPELVTGAAALVDAYKRNPLAVLQLVTYTSRGSASDFADAFRIRP